MVSRTIRGMSTYREVVTSPATWTRPVVTIVSTATRLAGSFASIASRMESLIWSQILSGWPSVTDSDVNRRRDGTISPRVQRLLASGPLVRTRSILTGVQGAFRDAEPARHRVPHRVGQGLLAALGDDLLAPLTVEQDGRRRVLAERAAVADLVDDEQVAALAGQLGPSVLEHAAGLVAGLGGEAHHHLAGPPRRAAQLGQHVGIAHQLKSRRSPVVGLLDLVPRRRDRAEV